MGISAGGRGLAAAALICAAVIVTTAPAHPARADDTAGARSTFMRAEARYKAREFARALALYKKAYELKPLPGFHFNIGQCYRMLGRCDKALEHYRQYLARSKPPRSAGRRRIWLRNRADVKKLIKACEEKLATKAPQSAPEEEPPAEEPPLEEEAADMSPVEGEEAEEPPPAPASGRRTLSSRYFWTGVGVSAVMLLTSVITGSVALSMSAEYKDPATSIPDRLDLRDTGTALRTTSTITFVLFAVAAAGTAALYPFTDFGAKEASVAAAPLEGGGVLTMSGRF